MGLGGTLSGKTVYIDSNIFIYAVEQHPDYLEQVRSVFEAIDNGKIQAVTSELTIMEVLTKPIERGLDQQQLEYESILTQTPNLNLVPVNRAIFLEAAKLRSSENLKSPDAIHVATATQEGCDCFLSNDSKLTKLQVVEGVSLA